MTIVFDTEPLVAHAFDEDSADTVSEYLARVSDGEETGYINTINLTELHYISHRYSNAVETDKYIRWLQTSVGIEEVEATLVWRFAADIKIHYDIALGDAFAVATGSYFTEDNNPDGVTLLVGADDDFNDLLEHDYYGGFIERFRDEPA